MEGDFFNVRISCLQPAVSGISLNLTLGKRAIFWLVMRLFPPLYVYRHRLPISLWGFMLPFVEAPRRLFPYHGTRL